MARPLPEIVRIEWPAGQAAPPAATDAALDRAARLCDGFIATPDLTLPAAAERAARYRAACDAAGRAPGPVAIRRDVYVGVDAAEARRTTAPVIAGGYRGLRPDVLVIGSAEEVAEHVAALGRVGYTDVIVRHVAVGQHDVVASTERLADVRALVHARPGDPPGQ